MLIDLSPGDKDLLTGLLEKERGDMTTRRASRSGRQLIRGLLARLQA